MLGWVLRVLLILLLLRLVFRFVAGLVEGLRQPPRPRAGAGGSPVSLVKDPVCGTYVVRSRALTAGTGDDARHFCSEACRDRWVRERRASQRSA